MGFLDNIFGSTNSSNESSFDWKNLLSIEQLEMITEDSNTKPILIFKHSTRCSISRMALKQFEREFDFQDKVTPYFLDLIVNRDVSNDIASRFHVMHQSPQVLLIKNGKSIYNASHSDINAEKIAEFV